MGTDPVIADSAAAVDAALHDTVGADSTAQVDGASSQDKGSSKPDAGLAKHTTDVNLKLTMSGGDTYGRLPGAARPRRMCQRHEPPTTSTWRPGLIPGVVCAGTPGGSSTLRS